MSTKIINKINYLQNYFFRLQPVLLLGVVFLDVVFMGVDEDHEKTKVRVLDIHKKPLAHEIRKGFLDVVFMGVDEASTVHKLFINC